MLASGREGLDEGCPGTELTFAPTTTFTSSRRAWRHPAIGSGRSKLGRQHGEPATVWNASKTSTAQSLTLTDLVKTYASPAAGKRHAAVKGIDLAIEPGRAGLSLSRSVRLRQDHHAAHDRRFGDGDKRNRFAIGDRGDLAAARRPKRGISDRLRELRAVPAAVRSRQPALQA